MNIDLLSEMEPDLDKSLRSSSAAALRRAQKSKPATVRWLAVRGEDAALKAGCRLSIWQGWLTIQALWVAAPDRGQGLGSQLLEKAEELARAEDCRGLEMTVFSLESADFFLKRGYTAVSRLPGETPEGERLWLVRSFTPLPTTQGADKPVSWRRRKREERKDGTKAAAARRGK